MRAEILPVTVLLKNSAAIFFFDKIPTGKLPKENYIGRHCWGFLWYIRDPDLIFVKETNGNELISKLSEFSGWNSSRTLGTKMCST